MKKLLFILLMFPLAVFGATTTVTKTTVGTATWYTPPGVTWATVKLWGSGGAGGGLTTDNLICRGAGGAGAQFAIKNIAVTPGTQYTYDVGAVGVGSTGNGTAGGNSTFDTNVVVAKGGSGGQSYEGGFQPGLGSLTGGVGDTVYKGGDGSAGGTGAIGGAGGGGAGTTGNGGSASGNAAGTGTSLSGGNGGAGRTTSGNGSGASNAGGAAGGGANVVNNITNNRNGSNGAAGRAEITYTTPPASALTDNFNDNSIDPAKWTNTAGTQLVETNNEIEFSTILAGSTGTGLFSLATAYDITGSAVTIKIVDEGNQSLASYSLFPILLADGSITVNWRILTGTISVRSNSVEKYSDTFSLSKYKYLRIRESGGKTYYDYSANGVIWTNAFNGTNELAITTVQPEIRLSSTAEASTTTAKFDDFNILPNAVGQQIVWSE